MFLSLKLPPSSMYRTPLTFFISCPGSSGPATVWWVRKWQEEGYTALIFNQGATSVKICPQQHRRTKNSSTMAPLLKAAETMESIMTGCISDSNDALPGENYLSHHQSEAALCGGLSHLAVWEEGQRDHQGLQTALLAAVCHTVLEHLVLQHRLRDRVYLQAIIPELCSSLLPLCRCATLFHVSLFTSQHPAGFTLCMYVCFSHHIFQVAMFREEIHLLCPLGTAMLLLNWI